MKKHVFVALSAIALAALVQCSNKQTREDEEPTASESQRGEEETSDEEEAPESSKETREADEAEDEERVRGPDDRYSAPVPKNWSAQTRDDYVTLSAPEGDLTIYLLASDETDLRAAIEGAWKKVAPKRSLAAKQTSSPPPEEGIDEQLVVSYELTDDKRVAQAQARRFGDRSYVALFDGGLSSVQRRSAQIQLVFSGFEIPGRQKTDLSGRPVTDLDDELFEELGSFAESSIDDWNVPGVAVAVVHGDELVWSDGFGRRKQGGDRPVDPETRMMIGSISKSMTSMLMAKAVDSEKFEWSTNATEVLPNFQLKTEERTQKIQMQHLVCACTGVPRHDFPLIFEFRDITAEQTIQSLATIDYFTGFGEAFQYSNQMVAAAGYGTAASFGTPWGELHRGYTDAMRRHVFKPIGMNRTTVDFEEAISGSNHAFPHRLTLQLDYEPARLESERFAIPVAPAGAVWSSAEDMARYLQTQAARGVAPNGTRVISEENLTETWKPRIEISSETSYALGWMRSEFRGKDLVTHGGGTLGFTSNVSFVPADRLGIVVLSNGFGASGLVNAIRDRFYELAYDVETPKAEDEIDFAREEFQKQFDRIRRRVRDSIDPKIAKPMLGRYESDTLGPLELRMEGERLIADVGEFEWRLQRLKPSEQKAAKEVAVYLIVDAPMFGVPLQVRPKENGERELVVGKGEISHRFTAVD